MRSDSSILLAEKALTHVRRLRRVALWPLSDIFLDFRRVNIYIFLVLRCIVPKIAFSCLLKQKGPNMPFWFILLTPSTSTVELCSPQPHLSESPGSLLRPPPAARGYSPYSPQHLPRSNSFSANKGNVIVFDVLAPGRPVKHYPADTQSMSRWNFGNLGLSPATVKLIASSCPSNDLAKTNKMFVNPSDLRTTSELAIINSKFVYVVSGHDGVEPSKIGLNSIQRKELRLAISDHVEVTPFEWSKKSSIEAKAATFEVDLVSKRSGPIEAEADEITPLCVRNLVGHVPTVGQSYIIDFYGSSLLLKSTSLVTESTVERAILKPTTEFYFAKAPGSGVKIKGGDSRPKDVFRSDFDFEKMGIGGLDKEFSDIFRRAFASRVFPPAVIQKLGIQHVKGMLLYGPPGTGKTLIARQIGKMLNGKEPKVVNGPEILNKYVGQSEENIRNLFQDAETEYAEQGDSSELHIIIFDEIDAICKQRGSTNSSSGVGDTVVNQLLSKIDGVNALNNILVIRNNFV